MRWPAALLALLLAWDSASPAAAATEEQEVLGLFDALPQPFLVEAVEATPGGRTYRLRSVEPARQTSSGAIYLRGSVAVSDAPDGASAAAEIHRRLAAADPDIGLSYAWDYVAAGDDRLAHLHAECTLSEESFTRMARSLARWLGPFGSAPRASFWCRCGGGCRAGAPFAESPQTPARMPPVRRPEGVEQDEYDNRLDPSGAWTSAIGELSLLHHANRLAFSYSAVFGPTAHICEGAGVAGLVGTDRYEHLDEQGTVAFVLAETGVRMEVVDGIASFCGAGWPGDRFPIDRLALPTPCLVATEHTHFHVVDTLDRERTFATVGRGSRLQVVPARHTGDDLWVLARHTGPAGTRMGLVARRDLDCPGEPSR